MSSPETISIEQLLTLPRYLGIVGVMLLMRGGVSCFIQLTLHLSLRYVPLHFSCRPLRSCRRRGNICVSRDGIADFPYRKVCGL
jgi:hypothetical protein